MQKTTRSRGLVGWAKSKTIWGTLAELFSGLLFSAGAFGSGELATKKQKRFVDWMKGHRKQTYGVVMKYYKTSLKEGKPMFKDAKFWLTLAGAATPVLIALQGMLPPDGIWIGIVGGVLAVIAYVRGEQATEQTKVQLESAQAEEAATRNLVQARQIEMRNLDRAISAGQTHEVKLSGMDVEL